MYPVSAHRPDPATILCHSGVESQGEYRGKFLRSQRLLSSAGPTTCHRIATVGQLTVKPNRWLGQRPACWDEAVLIPTRGIHTSPISASMTAVGGPPRSLILDGEVHHRTRTSQVQRRADEPATSLCRCGRETSRPAPRVRTRAASRYRMISYARHGQLPCVPVSRRSGRALYSSHAVDRAATTPSAPQAMPSGPWRAVRNSDSPTARLSRPIRMNLEPASSRPLLE
jgi:hypothetical protein